MFNIHLDNPLRGIGEIRDNIVIAPKNRTAVLNKAVSRYTVQNVSNVYKIMPEVVRFGVYVGKYAYGQNNGVMLCNKLVNILGDWNGNNECIFFHSGTNGNMYISLKKARIGFSEADANSDLVLKATKYLSENPLDTYYPLLTPEAVDISNNIDWANVPKTFIGTTTITADSALSPSDMSASYYTVKKVTENE